MLGAIFAVFASIVLGIAGIASVGKDLLPPAGLFAAVVVLLGYIVYAQRRTTALVKEEAEHSREEADRVFKQLSASPALTTGVAVRWRTRTYILFTVVLVAAGAGAAVAWNERSWWLLACGLVFAWAAKALLARLGEPDVLRVGSMGIEDKIGFGLIPWQDIESVLLHEYEVKGTKAAYLSIGVRDPAAYTRRLGPVARCWFRADALAFGEAIRIPLQTLDMAPLALFRLVRAFHERALPGGAIFGTDKYYGVEIGFAKLKRLIGELEKAPSSRHEELAARMDALIKAEKERIPRTRGQAEKTNWVLILAVVLVLLIALLVGARGAMPLLDIATTAALAVFLVILVRAAYLLRQNTYQRVREQERVSGPLPSDMPFTERIRLIGWKGMSPRNPDQVWKLLFVVGIGLAVLLWLR